MLRRSLGRMPKIAVAVAVFAGGIASAVSLFTPAAAPQASECTVVCITTTIPTVPTTLPTVPPLPTVPGSTSGTTTSTPTSTTSSPPPPPAPSPPATTTTTAGSTSAPASPPAFAVTRVQVTVVGTRSRRTLVVRLTVNDAARADLRLLQAKRSLHAAGCRLRSGPNVCRSRLPLRVRPGRYDVRLVVRDQAGNVRTVQRRLAVRR